MKTKKWGLLILVMAIISACSTTKPEVNAEQDRPQPKTFNQYYDQWENP